MATNENNWEQELRDKLEAELSGMQTYEIKGYLPFQTDKKGKIDFAVNKEKKLRILTEESKYMTDKINKWLDIDEAIILESKINGRIV